MIEAVRIYSFAVKRLGLIDDPAFDIAEARTALSDAITHLGIEAPTVIRSQQITTVAGQGEYAIDAAAGVIESIAFPSTWSEQMTAVTLQQLQTVRENVANGLQETLTNQPLWYALHRKASASSKTAFLLEPAASIAVGETITVRYYPIEYTEYNDQSADNDASQDGYIDLPQHMELMLKAYTTFHLAEIYAVDKAPYWKARGDEALRVWRRRMMWPDNRPQQRDTVPY